MRATEYDGVSNTLAAARRTGFKGRFLYMTASGVTTRSLGTILLNLYKGNTLAWRRRAEDEIRTSGLDYTIIRAGILLNRPGGQQAVEVSQDALPLAYRYRIARADVAKHSSRHSSTRVRRAQRSKLSGAEDGAAKIGTCCWAV